MARKQPQTLFEVYSSFRGVRHGPADAAAEPSAESTAATVAGTVAPRATPAERAAGDRYVIRLTAVQVFVAGLLALMALAVAAYAGYAIAAAKGRDLDSGGPTLSDVRTQPADPEVLGRSGNAPLAGDPFVFREPSDPAGTTGAEVPARGGDQEGLVDPALSGDWRVRIMSLPVEHRDTQTSLTQSRSFLAEKGIATEIAQRGQSYILYSKQTFPSESHEKAIELRDRIRTLGREYAQRVNRSNEFSSAYLARKS
jgi:hypothetical protein